MKRCRERKNDSTRSENIKRTLADRQVDWRMAECVRVAVTVAVGTIVQVEAVRLLGPVVCMAAGWIRSRVRTTRAVRLRRIRNRPTRPIATTTITSMPMDNSRLDATDTAVIYRCEFTFQIVFFNSSASYPEYTRRNIFFFNSWTKSLREACDLAN